MFVHLYIRKLIHSLKPVDYLNVQADNPWYNYYVNDAPIVEFCDHSMFWCVELCVHSSLQSS